jgi:leucine dehydrogenase
VLVSDIRPELSGLLAAELGCEIIPSEEVFATDCDVYAPCALGGTLDEQSTALLECRIVAGAANNQLQNAASADRLHRRRILYAPDYVINAGGAIALTLLHQGTPEKEARRKVVGIALTLAQILDEAASRNESPLYAAERRVAHARSQTRSSATTEAKLKFA